MSSSNDALAEILENTKFGRFINAESLALNAIRQAIITGVLPPGQEIDEEFIAEKLHVSRMPVRQALGILDSEGLVKREYRRGVRVTKLSKEEIRELYNIRAVLEGLAIRAAIPKYGENHLQRITEALEELNEKDNDMESFVETNTKFHCLLYEPSEWDKLLSMIENLRNNVSRYTALSHVFIQKLHLVHADHSKIYEAYKSRDIDEAERLIKDHILNSMNILLETFDEGAWVNG